MLMVPNKNLIEIMVGIKVLFTCCDGTSPNRTFICMVLTTRDVIEWKISSISQDICISFQILPICQRLQEIVSAIQVLISIVVMTRFEVCEMYKIKQYSAK